MDYFNSLRRLSPGCNDVISFQKENLKVSSLPGFLCDWVMQHILHSLMALILEGLISNTFIMEALGRIKLGIHHFMNDLQGDIIDSGLFCH